MTLFVNDVVVHSCGKVLMRLLTESDSRMGNDIARVSTHDREMAREEFHPDSQIFINKEDAITAGMEHLECCYTRFLGCYEQQVVDYKNADWSFLSHKGKKNHENTLARIDENVKAVKAGKMKLVVVTSSDDDMFWVNSL
jgi:hypothetical protein